MNKYIIIGLSTIIIIFLFIMNKTIEGNEGFPQKKGLLVLYGECFREGTQGVRMRDTETSKDTQKVASLSHIMLCNHIETTHKIKMDIIINTYETKHKSLLDEWYNGKALQIIQNKELIGIQRLVNNAVKEVNHDNYEFILFTRMDVAIKSPFLELFNPEWNKVYFISQNWTRWLNCGFLFPVNTGNINIPVVNPIIEYIPKKYFKILENIIVDHHAYHVYHTNFKLTTNDMDFMVDQYYDADSYKDYNPYYYMVGREQTKIHYDEGKLINRNLFFSSDKISC